MSLELVPVTLVVAKRFVAEHHRHNAPPVGWKFGVGIAEDSELVGVAMAGLPKSRVLMKADPYLIEVNRTCTSGARNANSMLYGAIARAAKALGYRRGVTYTLEEESGASLLAAGWVPDDYQEARDPAAWLTQPGRHESLFGPTKMPNGPKIRWRKVLACP